MKNGSLILNVVLLVGSCRSFLPAFFFCNETGGCSKISELHQLQYSCTKRRFSELLTFEMDSINNSYAKVKDVKSELGKEESRI